MYEKYLETDPEYQRIYMAGVSLTQLIGFKSLMEYCRHTTLIVGDLDTDEMLFFSNTIDQDEKNAIEGNTSRWSDYFKAACEAYISEEYREEAMEFYRADTLRAKYEAGEESGSIEYPCPLEAGVMWIRGCYQVVRNEETGHLEGTVVLIDATRLHTLRSLAE